LGQFRNSILNVYRTLDGQRDGDTILQFSILSDFGFGAITENQLKEMDEMDYQLRLSNFYNWVSSQIDYFDESLIPSVGNNAPFGDSATICLYNGEYFEYLWDEFVCVYEPSTNELYDYLWEENICL
jgi:hypothetical protein